MLAAVELWNLDGMCTDKYVVSKQLGSTSLEIVTAFTAQMLQILVAIICTYGLDCASLLATCTICTISLFLCSHLHQSLSKWRDLHSS